MTAVVVEDIVADGEKREKPIQKQKECERVRGGIGYNRIKTISSQVKNIVVLVKFFLVVAETKYGQAGFFAFNCRLNYTELQ